MASSYPPTHSPADSRARDDSASGASAPNDSEASASKSSEEPTPNDSETSTPNRSDASIPIDVPAPDSDLQSVIDQYERLLADRRRELERERERARTAANRTGVFGRLRRFLKSLR